MPEGTAGRHIDHEKLADFLEGKLPEEEARRVKEHLDRCALCRVELKRLERFRSIDADEDLARQAEWPYARTKLDSGVRHRVIPEIIGTRGGAARRLRVARAVRWLVPLAAAAILVVVIVRLAGQGEPAAPGREKGPMRGAPAAQYGITLEKPLGELDSLPGVFVWHSPRNDDYFSLEILDSRLRSVYRADRIAGSPWKAPDSLRTALRTDVIYLWGVKGYKGVERVISSPNGWFKIIGWKAAPP
jgi:hypothetical protein